jgi:predicted transcriptional regulator of viral defense system
LDPSHVTEYDDIPVTTVQRTIRDSLADGTDPYQLRLAVDQAEDGGSLRRSEAEALRAEIDAHAARTPA